jgi:hypothetical protein
VRSKRNPPFNESFLVIVSCAESFEVPMNSNKKSNFDFIKLLGFY